MFSANVLKSNLLISGHHFWPTYRCFLYIVSSLTRAWRSDGRTPAQGHLVRRNHRAKALAGARAPRGQFSFIQYEYTHAQRGPPRSRTQLHIHLLHFVLMLNSVHSVHCTVYSTYSYVVFDRVQKRLVQTAPRQRQTRRARAAATSCARRSIEQLLQERRAPAPVAEAAAAPGARYTLVHDSLRRDEVS